MASNKEINIMGAWVNEPHEEYRRRKLMMYRKKQKRIRNVKIGLSLGSVAIGAFFLYMSTLEVNQMTYLKLSAIGIILMAAGITAVTKGRVFS